MSEEHPKPSPDGTPTESDVSRLASLPRRIREAQESGHTGPLVQPMRYDGTKYVPVTEGDA